MIKKLFTIASFAILGLSNGAKAQTINTVAGNGTAGYSGDGGLCTAAELKQPSRVAFDAVGNLYIADFINHRIRKVTTAGIISTVAGNGTGGYSGDGGQSTAAELNAPKEITLDAAGNLYIADENNNRIRKVSTSGVISTYAGNGTTGFIGDNGQATSAEMDLPSGIALDAAGNLYIADGGNNRIRMVTTAGIISTVAGYTSTGGYSGDGGQATNAELSNPCEITFDTHGNLYIADMMNNRIRMVSTSGIITTIAGNGSAGFSGDGGASTAAKLFQPAGVTLDAAGNMYIADWQNNRIRKLSTSGIITTVAGNGTAAYAGDGGNATAAELNGPFGVALDAAGNLYIADESNNRIRMVSAVVTINNQPPFSSNYVICGAAGTNTVTIPSSQVGVTYMLITTTNTTTPVGSTQSGTGSSLSFPTGVITVTTTYGIVGSTATSTVVMNPWNTINVGPYPAVSAASNTVTLCSGSTATLTANGATTYSWSTSATTTTIAITPTVTSNYTVTGTDVYGCFTTVTITQTVITCSTGIEQILDSKEVSIYPNPAKDVLNVECLMLNGTSQITMYDMLGNSIYHSTVTTQHNTISVSDLAEGIYNISISSNEGVVNKRLVIVR